MSIDPPQADRIKEFFLFYLLKIAERSDIHNSSFVIHHSLKFHMSAASAQKNGQSDQIKNSII
jgi:hypothetical protein